MNGKRKTRNAVEGAVPFKGVTVRRGRYMAYIRAHRLLNLGTFDNPEDAAREYDRAAEHHFGAAAITNQSLGLLKDQET